MEKYQAIFTAIADAMADAGRWERPWTFTGTTDGALPVRHNGEPYKGCNVVMLWFAAAQHGFTSSQWMTYKQAQEMGGNVRLGEKSKVSVFFFSPYEREKEDGKKEKGIIRKMFAVFNRDQVDGLPALPEKVPVSDLPAAIAGIGKGATIHHGGDRAYYSPLTDSISLPPVEAFKSLEAYASTRAHECVHWTGHEGRLARKFGFQGSADYAVEELTAELGAAFVCASLGIKTEMRQDHAAYLKHWSKAIRDDGRILLNAAAAAQKAADYLIAATAG